jgi:hypothetical protein
MIEKSEFPIKRTGRILNLPEKMLKKSTLSTKNHISYLKFGTIPSRRVALFLQLNNLP